MASPMISKTHITLRTKLPILSVIKSPFSTTKPSFISSDQTHIVETLISLFTKNSSSQDLTHFASLLSPKLVESALTRFTNWQTSLKFFDWASKQNGFVHNGYTFNAMASILSSARQNAEMKGLASKLLYSNCAMSPGALGFFLRCLGSLGLVEEANVLFDRFKEKGLCVPNEYTYACLLEVLSKSSCVEILEMRLNEMMGLGFEMSKYSLTPLLQGYCQLGKFDKALGVFNEMNRKGWVDEHVFSILVVWFSKWGKVDEAFELVERMESLGLCLNEKTFRVLINGFVKEGRVEKGLRLFDKMRGLGFRVDVSLFDVVIGGLCKEKDIEKAIGLYRVMKGLGIRPDFGVVSKLVSCCSSGGEMVRLIEEAKRDMGGEEAILVYQSILNGLVGLGSIDEAHILLRSMMIDDRKLVKVNASRVVSCFRVVIDSLLKLNKADTALRLFNNMIDIGCAPDKSICNSLIDELCNSNRLEESNEIMRKMKNYGLDPTEFTHNSLFRCLCRREDVEGALEMVKKMRIFGHKPWIKYTSSFVEQLCQNGNLIQARIFLDKMLQQGFPPDIVSYSAILDSLVKSRKVDEALTLFRDICDRGCCPDVVAYNILINGFCKSKRISEAEDLANEMRSKGLVPSVVTYNLLVSGWSNLGDIDRALLCLSKMYSEKRNPNVITYTTLIDRLCSAQKPDDALKLFDEMRSKGIAPNRITFMALITGLCKCRKPEIALVYLREMEEKKMAAESFVYVTLLRAFLSDSEAKKAVEILEEMVKKGIVMNQKDKNYSVIKDAIHELLEDKRTSQSVEQLLCEWLNQDQEEENISKPKLN